MAISRLRALMVSKISSQLSTRLIVSLLGSSQTEHTILQITRESSLPGKLPKSRPISHPFQSSNPKSCKPCLVRQHAVPFLQPSNAIFCQFSLRIRKRVYFKLQLSASEPLSQATATSSTATTWLRQSWLQPRLFSCSKSAVWQPVCIRRRLRATTSYTRPRRSNHQRCCWKSQHGICREGDSEINRFERLGLEDVSLHEANVQRANGQRDAYCRLSAGRKDPKDQKHEGSLYKATGTD
jgi:hypothetical protein